MNSRRWKYEPEGTSARPSHEPTHPRPLPGGEQEFVRVLSVPLLGGVRGGFMVPMREQEVVEAFLELERRAPARRGAARPQRADLEIGTPSLEFMSTMRTRKTVKA